MTHVQRIVSMHKTRRAANSARDLLEQELPFEPDQRKAWLLGQGLPHYVTTFRTKRAGLRQYAVVAE